MINFNQGDVWLAKVYFKQAGAFKNRPVVVVGNDRVIDIDVLISPVTSHEARNEFDVTISDWKKAGLIEPSVARVSKLLAIPQSEFIRKLGVLTPPDLEKVLKKCRELF
jgi:mRNA-degrading endonuclease toxin of MazEF toxin-antitoxin module